MKILRILLAVAVLTGPFQEGTRGETFYSAIGQVKQVPAVSTDEVTCSMSQVEIVCSCLACGSPLADPQIMNLIPSAPTIPSTVPAKKHHHFEAPGMLAVSIRE